MFSSVQFNLIQFNSIQLHSIQFKFSSQLLHSMQHLVTQKIELWTNFFRFKIKKQFVEGAQCWTRKRKTLKRLPVECFKMKLFESQIISQNEETSVNFIKGVRAVVLLIHKCDLLWRNREQVASDIWLISDSTSQCRLLLSVIINYRSILSIC